MAGVLEAKHIGRGVVEGVECEHLAFRNLDTDWQIWVEVGESRCRANTSSPARRLAPRPSTRCGSGTGKPASTPAPDAFAFKPPDGSSGVAITLLKDIDEIPAGVVPGGAK